MNKRSHKKNSSHLGEGKHFITYHLANPILDDNLTRLKAFSSNWGVEKFYRFFNKYGSLLETGVNNLNQLKAADICRTAIHIPEGKDYELICYCILPNRIHIVFELLPENKGITKIIQAYKEISANKCNVLLGRNGHFWQDKSYDKRIKTDKELNSIIKYILLNPVKSGLVKNWRGWEYTYCNPDYIVL